MNALTTVLGQDDGGHLQAGLDDEVHTYIYVYTYIQIQMQTTRNIAFFEYQLISHTLLPYKQFTGWQLEGYIHKYIDT